MGSNVLGSLLGGGGSGSRSSSGGGGGGGLGALMGMLGGGGGGAGRSQGGVGGLLGSILGGAGKSGGGGGGGLGALAGMLGGGGGSSQGQGGAGGALGALMGMLGGGGGADQASGLSAGGVGASAPVSEDANQEAAILVRAMCNAAKADGTLDETEREKIIGGLGDEVTQQEIDFVQAELAAPVDVQSFVRDVPRGLEAQTYTFSLMAIKLDEQSEAKYLSELAQGLNLDADTCNQIHDELSAPRIFR